MNETTGQPSLVVTPAALDAVRQAFHEAGLGLESGYLRVGVKGGGCSGLSYVLNLETNRTDDDHLIERDGVRFLLDEKSEEVLRGTELDYTSGLNGRGFEFHNPNATGSCGCGQSFSV